MPLSCTDGKTTYRRSQACGIHLEIKMTPTEQSYQYAQIEKEALAFTWACEYLSEYLVGLKFNFQADYKPLAVSSV